MLPRKVFGACSGGSGGSGGKTCFGGCAGSGGLREPRDDLGGGGGGPGGGLGLKFECGWLIFGLAFGGIFDVGGV